MIEKMQDNGFPFAPKKPGDVGHDLYVDLFCGGQTKFERFLSEIVGHPFVIVWPFKTRVLPSGIRINQTDQTWCWITPRSSAARKGLLVFSGIIDSGYQGDLFTCIRNLSLLPRIIKQGERYAQAIFFNALRPSFVRVEEFSHQSARGDTGFGSSGR
jgi:dUTP pyrophosphatase